MAPFHWSDDHDPALEAIREADFLNWLRTRDREELDGAEMYEEQVMEMEKEAATMAAAF